MVGFEVDSSCWLAVATQGHSLHGDYLIHRLRKGRDFSYRKGLFLKGLRQYYCLLVKVPSNCVEKQSKRR